MSGDQSGSRLTAYITAMGNFGIQYNFQVIAIVLAFMDNSADSSGSYRPAYKRTDAQSSTLKSVVFAGAVVGQAVMGYAGDVLGRKRAMVLTNMFTAAGAIGCASFVGTNPKSVYTVITISRFFLGVGVGGKYPLTATMRSEGTAANEHAPTEVAKGFFWQTPGSVTPYLMATIIFLAFGKEEGHEHQASVSTQVRLLFLLGAVPAVAVAIMSMLVPESKEFSQRKTENPLTVAFNNPEHLRKLVGTGVSWFLYDFVYYGTSLNQPDILDKVFGKSETLLDKCWQNVVLNLMGLPGVILAILPLERMGVKALQNYGFLAITIMSLVLAMVYKADDDGHSLLFVALCFLIISLNWGVNISTYVLPSQAYPPEIRSSFFGLSAAMGKLGALVGASAFVPINKAVGFAGTYVVCAVISVLGILCTHAYVEPYWTDSWRCSMREEEDEDEDEDAIEKTLLDEQYD